MGGNNSRNNEQCRRSQEIVNTLYDFDIVPKYLIDVARQKRDIVGDSLGARTLVVLDMTNKWCMDLSEPMRANGGTIVRTLTISFWNENNAENKWDGQIAVSGIKNILMDTMHTVRSQGTNIVITGNEHDIDDLYGEIIDANNILYNEDREPEVNDGFSRYCQQ